jgi:glutamate formiminotransferase / formiminotetrahydrofolate cyclodeaminase
MQKNKKIIECVPNFCVGQDKEVIEKISASIEHVNGVTLKCVDTGFYANRTVITFLGEVEPMIEAAYNSIQTALELIDMRNHLGTHPRFGAVDVFPFVALAGIEENELVDIVNKFAERIATEFEVPIYLYEKSQTQAYRKDLAKIRKGEYEGLENKINDPKWMPDFHSHFNPKSGAIAMGVRDILVAFNINLNTKDVEIAKRIAEDIRHSGKIVNSERIRGLCEGVKAIGWYIQDFDKVQVSMNIVDYHLSPIHKVFQTCMDLADKYNVGVTGSELIGCVPKECLVEAGYDISKIYSFSKDDAINVAIMDMDLNEVKPFDKIKNVIDLDKLY